MRKVLIVGGEGQDGIILRRYHHFDDNVMSVGVADSKFSDCELVGPGFRKDSLKDFLRIVRNFKPDLVYYLAAVHGPETTTLNTDPDLLRSRKFIDDYGLKHLLDSLKALNQSINFFYSATSKLYKKNEQRINEATPFNPSCAYSESKLRAVEWLESIKESDLRLTIGMMFHHHSRFRRGDYALNKLAFTLAKGFGISSDGVLANPEAVEDFSCAIEMMRVVSELQKTSVAGRFVLASGFSRSLRDLADETVSRLSDLRARPNFKAADDRMHINRVYSNADVTKLKSYGLHLRDQIVACLADQVIRLRIKDDLSCRAGVENT